MKIGTNTQKYVENDLTLVAKEENKHQHLHKMSHLVINNNKKLETID